MMDTVRRIRLVIAVLAVGAIVYASWDAVGAAFGDAGYSTATADSMADAQRAPPSKVAQELNAAYRSASVSLPPCEHGWRGPSTVSRIMLRWWPPPVRRRRTVPPPRARSRFRGSREGVAEHRVDRRDCRDHRGAAVRSTARADVS